MTLAEAIKEISEAVESHKQFEFDFSGRHIAEVLVLKSVKIGADRLAEALEVVLEELKKEKTETILTDAEKVYLSAVIKPFKKRVIGITKSKQVFFDDEFISVKVQNIDGGVEDIMFPLFKKNRMYRGMKIDRRYSLKELGLE